MALVGYMVLLALSVCIIPSLFSITKKRRWHYP